MKKYLLIALLSITSVVNAQHGYHRHGHGGGNWLAPTLIGGILGYAIAKNSQPPQAVYMQPPYVTDSVTSAPPVMLGYTQPVPPPGYKIVYILDYSCNCYRQAFAPY